MFSNKVHDHFSLAASTHHREISATISQSFMHDPWELNAGLVKKMDIQQLHELQLQLAQQLPCTRGRTRMGTFASHLQVYRRHRSLFTARAV
jgi:hypothetical protein